MAMNEQAPQEAMPQEGQQGAPQGADVMKELGAVLMQSAQQDEQASQVIAQMGNKQASELLAQASQLKQQALQALGVQAGPPQEGGMSQPNAAGEGVAPVGPAV